MVIDLEKHVTGMLEDSTSVEAVCSELTEAIKLSKGEHVVVAHGIYAGFRGKIEKELPGGYYSIKVDNVALGSVSVPAFALRPVGKIN